MTIKILHQYHNNAFDTVKALEQIADVEFLTYRTSKLVPGIAYQQPVTVGRRFRQYIPWQLWRLIPATTDILILKHINDPINFFPYLIAWVKGIKCVVIVQRPTSHSFPGYHLLHSLLTWFLRVADARALAVTKEGLHWVTKHSLKAAYIPACINPHRFRLSLAHRGTPSPHILRLLTVSKYQKRKNLPLLIQAIAELQKKYPHIFISLTVVGNLSQRTESREEYKTVRDAITQHKLGKNVTLRANVLYQDMPTEYTQADAFILAAESEPLGYAVVEAMASGLPVICTSEVGASSYIQEGENGYVVAPRSFEAIMEALHKLIRKDGTVDTELLTKLGQASKELVDKNHSPGTFIKRFRALTQA
jgi:glycosyltransferase involved in cell wall biosynthesis